MTTWRDNHVTTGLASVKIPIENGTPGGGHVLPPDLVDGVTLVENSSGKLAVAAEGVADLTVKTDSVGTDLLVINRGGVDYATPVSALETTIHALDTIAPAQADELPFYDISGNATGKMTIAQLASLVASINGTSSGGSTTPTPTPTYATTMTVSAPSTMTVGTASTVTVTGGSGGLDPAKTFTPSAPVAGTFSPTSQAGNGTTALTFSFTPSAAGSGTFSASASGVTATASGSVTVVASGGSSNTTARPALALTNPAFASTGDSPGPIFGGKSFKSGTGAVTVPVPANANGNNQASVGVRGSIRLTPGPRTDGTICTLASSSGGIQAILRINGNNGATGNASAMSASIAGSGYTVGSGPTCDGQVHSFNMFVESKYNFNYGSLYTDTGGGHNNVTNGVGGIFAAGDATFTLNWANMLPGDMIDNIEITTTDYGTGTSITTPITATSTTLAGPYDFENGTGASS